VWQETSTTSQAGFETSEPLSNPETDSPTKPPKRSTSSMSSWTNPSRALALVWKTTPEMSWTLMQNLLGMAQTIASFAWKDQTGRQGSSDGWRLAFELEMHKSGNSVTLLLWPEPSPD